MQYHILALQMNQEQKWNKTTTAIKTFRPKMSRTLSNKLVSISETMSHLITGFQLSSNFSFDSVLNIKHKLHYW